MRRYLILTCLIILPILCLPGCRDERRSPQPPPDAAQPADTKPISRINKLKAEGVDALPELLEFFAYPATDVREAAAKAVVDLAAGQPLVIASLIETLADARSPHRIAAAGALGMLTEHPGVLDALGGVLNDGDESLRYFATLSLGRGGADAVPYLIDALSNSAPRVIKAAAESLGRIGGDAGAALPRLNELLEIAVPGAVIYSGETGSGEIKVVTLSEDEAAGLHLAIETAIEDISNQGRA